MARIVGVEIPNEKRIEIALTYVYGIGLTTSQQILKSTGINPDTRAKDLKDSDIKKMIEYIEKNVPTEGQVRQRVFNNIKRQKDIRTYRGIRHKLGLPVRGQNIRTNARTRKGKNAAVGGLKVKLTQK